LSNDQHLTVLDQGVAAWNQWREGNPGVRPRLEGADLHERDLVGVDFRRAALSGANLYRANLRRANLDEAILTQANSVFLQFKGALSQ
jgi:uncharacterized protein YjbI with pentapeptide repeats